MDTEMEIDKNDVVATAASSSGEPRNSKERVAANNAANTDEGGVSNAGDVQPSKKPRLNEETPQESKGKERKTAKDKEELEDMEWVCALCKEAECLMQPNADEFLICDGGCERVFHYPCAGLSQIPDQNQDWMCQDCTQGRHLCAFCHEYGQDGVDVFMCQKTKCGLYFHESCLALNNVPVTMQESTIVSQGEDGDGAQHSPKSVEANPLGNETVTLSVPVFTCPAHRCWTCTQDEERQKEQEKVDAEKLKKKKKRGKKPKSIFMCKTEGRLFRCLHCPLAFHVTCIPFTSKVNELGVLCPEHANTHKLPDIDHSTSIQRHVEAKIAKKLDKMSGKNEARRLLSGLMGGRGTSANAFFPGVRGDRLVKVEQEYVDHMDKLGTDMSPYPQEDNNDVTNAAIHTMCGGLAFCLPIDIKTEVHSKPPNYTLIHALRFDPNKRPKRIPATGEQCQCTDSCDNHCYNRMSLDECCGEGPNSNCGLGPSKCNNRSLGKRQYVKCKPKRENGKGWGLVTEVDISKGQLIQEYVGEVVDEEEKERRLIEWNKEHPNDPNFYVMGLGIGWYIDAREYGNMSRFINHSCDPSCQVTTINVRGYKRNGIFALRDIKAGEFLSYDYHFDTKQADRFACRCGAKNCRGTMQGGGDLGAKKPLDWKDAKAKYEADVKQLAELNQQQVTCQVDILVPGAEQPTEFVSNGPLEKHGGSGRLLWRNAMRGSDFVARNSRLETTKK